MSANDREIARLVEEVEQLTTERDVWRERAEWLAGQLADCDEPAEGCACAACAERTRGIDYNGRRVLAGLPIDLSGREAEELYGPMPALRADRQRVVDERAGVTDASVAERLADPAFDDWPC